MAEGECPSQYSVGWVKYAWLVYLGGIPLTLALGHASAGEWLFELAGVAVALVLYLRMYDDNPTLVSTAYLAAFFVLGAIYAPRNDSTLAYFIYGAAFIGFAFDRVRAGTMWSILAAYVVAIGIVAAAEHLHLWTWVSATVFSGLIGAVNIRAGEMKRATERLRLAYDEVERLSAVAERERIARDLHDVLGHTLSLVVLKSELASKLADVDPARAADEIRQVERIARASLGELREALAGYRTVGVAAELDHARAVLVSAGLDVTYEAGDVQLPPAHEGVLALAIREAVTNVVRHARARRVSMHLAQDASACRFEIVDDGRGIDGAAEGWGLVGMRERIESLGGTLDRRSDRGTRLVVTLPLRA